MAKVGPSLCFSRVSTLGMDCSFGFSPFFLFLFLCLFCFRTLGSTFFKESFIYDVYEDTV